MVFVASAQCQIIFLSLGPRERERERDRDSSPPDQWRPLFSSTVFAAINRLKAGRRNEEEENYAEEEKAAVSRGGEGPINLIDGQKRGVSRLFGRR